MVNFKGIEIKKTVRKRKAQSLPHTACISPSLTALSFLIILTFSPRTNMKRFQMKIFSEPPGATAYVGDLFIYLFPSSHVNEI